MIESVEIIAAINGVGRALVTMAESSVLTDAVAGVPPVRYLLVLEYVGTSFHGSQRQDGNGGGRGGEGPWPSVQSELEAALAKLAKHSERPPTAVFCGRTDAGVHATASVVHTDIRRCDANGNPLAPFSQIAVLNALNHALPSSKIGVVGCRMVPRHFHARHSACERTYVYKIRCDAASNVPEGAGGSGGGGCSNSGSRHPTASAPIGAPLLLHLRSKCSSLGRRGWLSALDRQRALCLAETLDLSAMRAAAAVLLGEHDFSSLRAPSCTAASPVRQLHELRIVEEAQEALGIESRLSSNLTGMVGGAAECEVRFSVVVRAPSFLKSMVRRIVAVLLEAGRGRISPQQVTELLAARDPSRGPVPVAAHGLYLSRVDYPSDAFDFEPRRGGGSHDHGSAGDVDDDSGEGE